MALRYDTQETNFRFRNRRKTTQWIRETVAAEGFQTGEIAIVFCSDACLLEVNRTWLGHDYPTDIITFDDSDLPHGVVSGDLLIGIDTVRRNAAEYNTPPDEELLRVIIHGVLHLCGYGDKTPTEAALMRQKEDFYIALHISTLFSA